MCWGYLNANGGLRRGCGFVRKPAGPAGVQGASSSLVVERTEARDGRGQEEQEETPQEEGLHLDFGLLA